VAKGTTGAPVRGRERPRSAARVFPIADVRELGSDGRREVKVKDRVEKGSKKNREGRVASEVRGRK